MPRRKKVVLIDPPNITVNLINACASIIKRARRRETIPYNPHGATLEQLLTDCHNPDPEVRIQIELLIMALKERLTYYAQQECREND